ncbi:unnamed protein product [Fraxinus pennsylvanica]|uniref:RRM domain-containing protein n=1 Tax=Fraxinus pennsylvanica TaxID=56036 RepID=A0AAD2E2X8_9LAMI|nr:unnamed protein product [Fraxinus pennsylvanica]
MAVVENAGANVANRADPDAPKNEAAVDHHHHHQQSSVNEKSTKPADQNFHLMVQKISPQQSNGQLYSINGNGVSKANITSSNNQSHKKMNGEDDGSEGFKREMRDLEEMLSKLNPMAQEFVPPSLGAGYHGLAVSLPQASGHFVYDANGFLIQQHVNSGVPNGNSIRRKNSGYSNGKRRINSRTNMAQREEVIRRTVYVSDIDHQVTEEELAALFIGCGQVVDCRVTPLGLRHEGFAFIEFTDEEGARNALSLAGTMLGYYPVRVLPSKTAIAPVNPTFLPRSEDERKMCARTIYCTNIDKKITQADIKLFFESICGEVLRLRLLGDYIHSTRIAFVEFVMAESAIAALNCSGAVLGSLPIRVSPSKTPVRPRAPRQAIH